MSTIKGHLRNRCGFGRTAHARCHTITVPIRAADAEVASGGVRGGAARLGGLYEGALQGAPSISEGASAVCTSHQSSSSLPASSRPGPSGVSPVPASKRLRGWESDDDDDEA